MDIIAILHGEHGMLLRIIEAMEEYTGSKRGPEWAASACRMGARLIRSHTDMEDELLFPALAGRSDYTAVIIEDHQRDHFTIRKLLREAEKPGKDAAARIGALATCVRNHFEKEEVILFPMVRMAVPEKELEKLGDDANAYRHMEKYRKSEL